MIVCLCHGISDRHIKDMVDRGAQTIKDVQRQCRLGMDCGQCVGEARTLVNDQCKACPNKTPSAS